MSCATLHVFNKDGEIRDYVDYPNSWHGAILIWTELAKKYGVKDPAIILFDQEVQKKIWGIADNKDADPNDRIVMATTFDRVVVYRKDFPRLVEALRECSKSLPSHCHVVKQANDIEALIDNEDVIAIGWTCTSVASDVWSSGEMINEDEEMPYNLNKHNRHWDLFSIFEPDLHEQCKNAVGKHIKYKGTNGDEYRKNYGDYMEGEGLCTAYHDSHGLCIMVKDINGIEFCIDPTEISY